jgi:hypothetical protein
LPTLQTEYAARPIRVIASAAKQSILVAPKKEGMDGFVAFAPRNDGEHSFAISPQVCARLILNFSPSDEQRAQGMPGARCARSLACRNYE